MKVLILADLHGNLSAMQSILKNINHNRIDGCILLGDIIDYGMHSNEVVNIIQSLPYSIICNIWGNHERAILFEEYSRFSSQRGQECARYTRSILNDNSWNFIQNNMTTSGRHDFVLCGKKCLAVHGSLEDVYWESIRPDQDLSAYKGYDYVFSGHSHLPHFFEKYFDTDNPQYRNKKKTIFINPGSVGQPRNHIPMAQCALLDMETEEIEMIKVNYDVKSEQLTYTGMVDDFYRKRLECGI